MTRSIAILASGTRGDVQPLIALGLGLRRNGYRVRLVTHPPFAPLAAPYNLPFAPLQGDLNQLLSHPAWRDALMYNGRPLRTLVATVSYLQAARPIFRRMLHSAWAQCQGVDQLIVTLPTTWGVQIAEALGIPCVVALLQPLGETAAFPSPFQPFARSLGPAYNRLSHRLSERALWQPWRNLLNQWRQTCLGLPPLRRLRLLEGVLPHDALFLYGISPQVVPRPADWPPERQLVGYWFLDPPPGWEPPPELVRFLRSGPPPIYVGFGSTGASDERTLRMVVAAIERAGVRALLAGATGRFPSHITACPDVPHNWLFPQVAAVVHHGGAGTTAAALRAGAPQVIIPRGIDHFFWSTRVNALGCGPPAIPHRTLTVEGLAAALTTALGEPAIRERATALGYQIRAEDGIGRAVELLPIRPSERS